MKVNASSLKSWRIAGGRPRRTSELDNKYERSRLKFAAELFRLYRPLPEQRKGNGDEQRDAVPVTAALEAEISAIKQLNQMLRDQLDDTRGQRDKWEQAAQTAPRQLPPPKAATRSWWWPMRRAA